MHILNRTRVAFAILFFTARLAFGRDVTFFVAADLHYGQDQSAGNEQPNKDVIAVMNNLPGADYPQSDFGTVAAPRGVLLAGDLTDSGTRINFDGTYLGIHLFDGFIDDYPVKGGSGVHLHWPVFEGYGNHDVQKQTGDTVLKGIALRNKNRALPVNVSQNGLHYSWDWDDVHFVNLNLCAGGRGDARDSLDFLKKDLADHVGNAQKPVVIVQHYGFDAVSIEDRWWKQADRDAFYKIIKNYKIEAIFTGHEHRCRRLLWNGIADFVAPRAKGDKGEDGIYAVRMMDNKMIVAQRRLDGDWGKFWIEDLIRPAR